MTYNDPEYLRGFPAELTKNLNGAGAFIAMAVELVEGGVGNKNSGCSESQLPGQSLPG